MFLALLLFLCVIILKKITLLVFFFWQGRAAPAPSGRTPGGGGSMHESLPPAPGRCSVPGISLLWHRGFIPVVLPQGAPQLSCSPVARSCQRLPCVGVMLGPGERVAHERAHPSWPRSALSPPSRGSVAQDLGFTESPSPCYTAKAELLHRGHCVHGVTLPRPWLRTRGPCCAARTGRWVPAHPAAPVAVLSTGQEPAWLQQTVLNSPGNSLAGSQADLLPLLSRVY